MLPYWDEVELCHAQYCVPNPDSLFPVAVATTYGTVLFVVELVLPNWPAALTASAASCDCVGCDGAADALSAQVVTKIPLWFPACWPDVPHVIVPFATPWQYW